MVSVSGDLGGNSGVVRPGTCRLLFCLLLLVVVVIIIALFGGGGWGWREYFRQTSPLICCSPSHPQVYS